MRRSSLRHLRTAAVLASAVMLVSIVLSALPQEKIPLPFRAGHRQDRHTSTATVTDEAETVFRLVEGAGLPVENAVLYAHREEDPDGLLGVQNNYRSKLTFEDRRIDGGAVTAPDPGSVHLGGAIEVFPGADAARSRAERLQTSAARSPAHAEHAYLKGRILLRLSPYLTESAADAYAAPLYATEVVRPGPERNTADA
ncbi:hypothetical protein [Streptomyces qaidamensis]|uniref:hypothetical protein n=1 Tax=Streptomyces qaidamensis TaxID=1783515 RepID=UPI00131B28EE|nr:hypothetical protein [Streptomyces qaidamensis]